MELQLRSKLRNIWACDITRKRLMLYKLNAKLSIQNAEKMKYSNDFFDHINCQGVLHHTPDIESAIQEIYRVLKGNGTVNISLYYKNIFLRAWKYISLTGGFMYKKGGGLIRKRKGIDFFS